MTAYLLVLACFTPLSLPLSPPPTPTKKYILNKIQISYNNETSKLDRLQAELFHLSAQIFVTIQRKQILIIR
jgi:hypothetical protein